MGRIKCRYKVRSALVGFIPGEDPQERHSRRFAFNMAHLETIQEWRDLRGVTLNLSCNQHHWNFRRGDRRADWRPSSANLVIGRRVQHAIHVHDYRSVLKILGRVFPYA